jgi:hypothetical protein
MKLDSLMNKNVTKSMQKLLHIEMPWLLKESREECILQRFL